jgi:hypothetical protein
VVGRFCFSQSFGAFAARPDRGVRAEGETHPKKTTRKARKAYRASFYKDIPEDLPQVERDRRAEAAFKEHMARLAFLSAKARRKAGTDEAAKT